MEVSVKRRTWMMLGVGTVMMAAAWAMAQTSPQPPPHAGFVELRGLAGPKLLCENRDAVLAAALAFLRTKLEIATAQEQAWQRFSAAATQSLTPLAGACAELAQKPPPATLLDRLAVAERFSQVHLQVIQLIRPALGELYDALTPEQRQRLDALPFGRHR
jgi:hypothetical protein